MALLYMPFCSCVTATFQFPSKLYIDACTIGKFKAHDHSWVSLFSSENLLSK